MTTATQPTPEQLRQAMRYTDNRIRARYSGTCALSGKRYAAGESITKTPAGWALVRAACELAYGERSLPSVARNDQALAANGADLSRLMDRADSSL